MSPLPHILARPLSQAWREAWCPLHGAMEGGPGVPLSSGWTSVITAAAAKVPQASGTPCPFSQLGCHPATAPRALGFAPPLTRPGSALPPLRSGPSSRQELSSVGRFPRPLLPMVQHSASSRSQPCGHRPHLLPKCPVTAAQVQGPGPPGVTPHSPFLLCLAAPPEGLFQALKVEWESRPSPADSPRLL